MNKWWLVGLSLPAVVGLMWIAISRADNEKTPARSLPAQASPEVAASPRIPVQLPKSENVPRKTAAAVVSAMPLPNQPMAMKDLQELLDKDPKAALAAAREGLARDPEGPDAAEQTWVVVKALTVMGRHQEARREAEAMVPKFRDTRWANDIERHVLAHP